MELPYPVLAGIGIVILVLIAIALRRRTGGRDLMAPPPGLAGTGRAGPAAAPVTWQRGTPLPANVEEEVRALLREGKKINAVKRVREVTGLGLKEALDLVEQI